jgi:hypothetical protein
MTCANLVVNLRLRQSNEGVLRITGHLAQRFSAGVTGFCLCRPIVVVCGAYSVPAAIFEEDRRQTARDMDLAEREFRTALRSLPDRLTWRHWTTTAPLAGDIATEARAADLIVTRPHREGTPFDSTRDVDAIDLVMQAGRPVLLVPGDAAATAFDHVVVGWKEGREARRAIADAMPVLSLARRVTVVAVVVDQAVAPARSKLEELVAWLKRHRIAAEPMVVAARTAFGRQFTAIARELAADLVVAGACANLRHGEWALGGVTAELLRQSDRCVLLSN